jgi:hypothetical protein
MQILWRKPCKYGGKNQNNSVTRNVWSHPNLTVRGKFSPGLRKTVGWLIPRLLAFKTVTDYFSFLNLTSDCLSQQVYEINTETI